MLSPAWRLLKVKHRLLPSDPQTFGDGWRHSGAVYGSQEPHVAAPLEMWLVGPRKWILNQQPHPWESPELRCRWETCELGFGSRERHLCFFLRQLT